MVITRRLTTLTLIGALATGAAIVSAQSGEPVDLAAIQRIKEEGFDRSKVMDTAWWLTDMYGPRLTNSPQMRAAADWAVKQLSDWGLANVKEEPWGSDFGRGWSNQRTVVHVVKPEPWPVIAYARAWTPGTSGPITAEAVLAPMPTEADFDAFRGKLKGKIALLSALREVKLLWDAQSTRFTTAQLDAMSAQEMPRRGGLEFNPAAMRAFQAKRNAFLLAEGVLAVIEPGTGMGDSGSVLVASGGSRDPKDPPVPTQLSIATEHYNRIARLVQHHVPVALDLDVQSTFQDTNLGMVNIVAEIPGTDKADEIVMLGAHFDS